MDFGRPYYTPMDQEYHNEVQRNTQRSNIEKPIFPISLIGQTIPEVDRSGRSRNIVEGVDAAFRGGAGNIQIVMQGIGQTGAPEGGGPRAYGEDVRESIREVQKAAGGKITGVELPTSLNNLTGFSQQGFNEDQRRLGLDEVKDAIKFVGDISGGGGVDIVSFEFPRNFSDAKWANRESESLNVKESELFTQREKEMALLVDKDTGKIVPFDKTDKFYLYYDKTTNKSLDPTSERPQELTWKNIIQIAKNEDYDSPEKFLFDKYQVEKQANRIKGDIAYMEIQETHEDRALEQIKEQLEEVKGTTLEQVKKQAEELAKKQEEIRKQSEELRKKKDEAGLAENQGKMQEIAEQMRDTMRKESILKDKDKNMKLRDAMDNRITGLKDSIQSMKQQEEELKSLKDRYKPIDEFGTAKAAESYAEAGIFAMRESQKNQFVQKGKGSIHVGPEMGWPQYYGSHPTEWVGLIKSARKEMVDRLTSKDSPYHEDISKKEAEELAKKHIKGELDTAHLGMWLQNFRQDLPWDKRVNEFKSWYKDQMEYLAKENKEHDLIGGIQVVDSASGAHGHLPPGQGVLGKDIFEYMKILKEKGGYTGEFTSEGHEEEKFGQGRILTKAWEAFGSPISTGYFQGRPMPTFTDIRTSYAQIAYGTTGIFQSYVPSNDFTLWSNVPLE